MKKITKAQAKRRLMEALNKCNLVFMSNHRSAMSIKDYEAIDRILTKCMNRLK